jgi:hypothetical protein
LRGIVNENADLEIKAVRRIGGHVPTPSLILALAEASLAGVSESNRALVTAPLETD